MLLTFLEYVMELIDERTISIIEQEIPKLAKLAIRQAYVQALASGSSVVQAIDGKLVKMNADGSMEVLKKLKDPVKVEIDSTVRLQL